MMGANQQNMRLSWAQGAPVMCANILPFIKHASVSRLRKRRKKIVRSDCVLRHLFDPGGNFRGRPRKSAAQPADGGAIAPHLPGERLVSERPFGHPLGECHAGEGAPSARASQAQCARNSIDASPTRAQNAQMPATKRKPAPTEPRRLGLPFLSSWRKFRKEITQEALAERIGKDRSIVTKLESGRLAYNQGHLDACAETLECEPWQLLVVDPLDPSWPYRLFNSLDPVSRKQLIKIAKEFKE